MGDDDKPFACTAPGCGQRFTNEDHLTVHKQKHEMTLKFGPPKLGDILPVADQTPTPTRFLKNCEEVGLFNELPNVNPFEHEFKKAAEKQQSEKEAMEEVIHEPPTTTVIITGPMVETAQQTHIITSSADIRHSPEVVSTTTSTDDEIVVHSSVQEPVTVTTPIAATSITTQAPSQMIAHIQAGQNNVSTVPIVLQLPNGATLPVALPASVANPNVPVPTAISAFQHAVPAQIQQQQQQASTTSEAKLKLKAALTQGNMNVMSQAVEVVTRRQEEELQRQQQHQHQQQQQQTEPLKRRRRNTHDDPDQRRKKFLERNRAAAMRCRNKKKVWINSLEGKAEELTQMNHQLQNEVTTLRNEVAHLKQLLLAHKDCPITMLQQKTQHQMLAVSASHVVTDHKTISAVSSSQQVTSVTAAEAVATSALTTMAQMATTELQTSQSSVTAN